MKNFHINEELLLRTIQEQVSNWKQEVANMEAQYEAKLEVMRKLLEEEKTDNQELKKENRRLRRKYNFLEERKRMMLDEKSAQRIKIKHLEKENSRLRNELEGVCPDRNENIPIISKERDVSWCELIEKFVIIAENYPSNQNDKAVVIKTLIQSVVLQEHLSLPQDLLKRLQSLGGKETAMARSLIDVSGNDKVIFGGINNG